MNAQIDTAHSGIGDLRDAVAALTERLRKDHDMVPITTVTYGGAGVSDVDAKLEAFSHQVKAFSAKRERPRDGEGWLSAVASLWK